MQTHKGVYTYNVFRCSERIFIKIHSESFNTLICWNWENVAGICIVIGYCVVVVAVAVAVSVAVVVARSHIC